MRLEAEEETTHVRRSEEGVRGSEIWQAAARRLTVSDQMLAQVKARSSMVNALLGMSGVSHSDCLDFQFHVASSWLGEAHHASASLVASQILCLNAGPYGRRSYNISLCDESGGMFFLCFTSTVRLDRLTSSCPLQEGLKRFLHASIGVTAQNKQASSPGSCLSAAPQNKQASPTERYIPAVHARGELALLPHAA